MARRPSIRRYYDFSSALIVVLAISIGLSASIVPAWLAVTFISLCAVLKIRPHSTPSFKGIAITVGAVAFAASLFVGVTAYQESLDIVFFFGPFFTACLAVSLLFQSSPKLDWKICVSTLLLAVTSVIGGGSVLDHFLFIVFCGAFVFYLNATYFIETEPTERLPAGYFRPFILCLIAGWSFGLFIFVFFPRTIQWSNPFGLRDRQSTTGYSGALSLAGAGPNASTAIALVVEPLDSADRSWIEVNGPDLYFRGNILDQFDGEKWHQTLVSAQPFKAVGHNRPRSAIHGVKIYREPHSAPWIVFPGIPWNIELPFKITGQTLIDESGNLLRSILGYLRYSYTADFEESPVFFWGHSPSLSIRETASYLSLPTEFKRKGFFRDWLDGFLQISHVFTLQERLALLSNHFQKQFTAVLGGKSLSLENFLLKNKEGHCEYFATAATLALRHWGYPARVVLGYRGGHFNRFSQVLEVKDENAHAWVEVFIEKKGWLRYDPTPMVRRQAAYAWTEEWQLWTGAAKYWFGRYVVDYNSRTQTELLLSFGKTNPLNLRKQGSQLKGALKWIGFPLLALGFFLLVKILLRRSKRKIVGLPIYYLNFQKRLRRFGFIRAPQESFKTFHQRIQHPQILNAELQTIDLKLEHDLYASNS